MEPAWKCSTSGTSATITRPSPNTNPVQASTNVRSTRSRAMNTNPARSPRCSVASERSPAKGARTVHTRTAETANVTAFRPNTHAGPMAATSTPPIAGPTMTPAFRPSEIRPFAPNVRSRVADSHAGERVRSYTVNISAVYAAAPPVIEMRRAVARRRTAAFGEVWVVMKRLLDSVAQDVRGG